MNETRIYNSIIATNVRFIKSERRLTDRRIEELTNGIISKSLVGMIEKARHTFKVPAEHVRIIAEVLNVSEDVINETNSEINVQLRNIEQKLMYLLGFDESQLIQKVDNLIWKTSVRSPREFAIALILRGRIEYNLGKLDSALSYFNMAYNLGERAQDYEIVFKAQHDKLCTYLAQGKLEKTYENCIEELERIRNLERLEAKATESSKPEKIHIIDSDTKKAKMHYLLGTYYSLLREWEKAKEECEKALAVVPKRTENKVLVGSYYQALGDCYKNLNDGFENCLLMSHNCISIARELNDPLREIYALKTIGEVWYKKGDPQTALKYFTLAHEITKDLPLRKIDRKKIEFWLAVCNDDLTQVISYLDNFENLPPRDYAEFIYESAEVAVRVGQHDYALKLYKKASQKLLK